MNNMLAKAQYDRSENCVTLSFLVHHVCKLMRERMTLFNLINFHYAALATLFVQVRGKFRYHQIVRISIFFIFKNSVTIT